jgi:hypothetical protein
MTLARSTSLLGVVALIALGCGNEGSGSGGSGGGSTSSGVTSSTSTTTSPDTTSSTSTGSVVIEPSGFSCSGASPSLTNDIVPNITTPNCSGSDGCHVAMHSAPGVMDMMVGRIAEQCTDIRYMVNPGDPEHSYVIHKLTNHNICAGTQQMPKGGQMLPDDQIQTIYDWICQGALSN